MTTSSASPEALRSVSKAWGSTRENSALQKQSEYLGACVPHSVDSKYELNVIFNKASIQLDFNNALNLK